MQTNVLEHFQVNKSRTIRTPKIIKALDGQKFICIKRNNQKYIMRLVTYINGDQLKDIKQKDISYFKIGSFIGELASILQSFSDKYYDRVFPWDISNIDFLHDNHSLFSDQNKENIIIHFINEYEKNVEPNKKFVRKSIIHNDCNDHNIIVRNQSETIGVIDFGDIVHSYIIVEPAVCIAYAVLGKKNPFEIVCDILRGYCNSSQLSEVELKLAIYFVCIRLCISVTMAKYRSEIFPENEYLMVSNIKAWEFLQFMFYEDLRSWSNKVVQNVRK
jgi:Ser/Thr protein kinase RdoA (MazF antagonist)